MTETAPPDADCSPDASRRPSRPRPQRRRSGRGFGRIAVLAAALAAAAAGCTREPAKQSPATATTPATLLLNGRPLSLDVVADEPSRQLGLRFKDALPDDRGMLLVYQADEHAELPTGGLRFDLDAVLIDASGRVAAVRPVDARGDGDFLADVPARFVLLVARGVAGKAGLAPGGQVALPADATRLSEPRVEVVHLGGRPFRLEVAATDARRQKGLMHRAALAPDAGMVFVFPSEQHLAFWMKNTRIPLDIVYLTAAGRIVSVKQMAPFDLRTAPSEGRSKYAIELNQGTAAQLGLKPGDQVDLPERVKNPPDLE